jgi:predicted amidohydrolase
MWNCPYDNAYFRDYAETESGPSAAFMARMARENRIWLVGGSIPELDGDRVYNTAFVFSPRGELAGRHRKIHLFDVDIQGGVRFRESDTLTAGDAMTLVDTDLGRIGVAICYDLRFPGLLAAMADAGAHLIILPAIFSLSTGSAHWELLIRTRALDNQIYLGACSAARNPEARYQAWGHSCIATPWGDFCGKGAISETIVCGDIDPAYATRVQEEMPVRKQRREGIDF